MYSPESLLFEDGPSLRENCLSNQYSADYEMICEVEFIYSSVNKIGIIMPFSVEINFTIQSSSEEELKSTFITDDFIELDKESNKKEFKKDSLSQQMMEVIYSGSKIEVEKYCKDVLDNYCKDVLEKYCKDVLGKCIKEQENDKNIKYDITKIKTIKATRKGDINKKEI